MILGAIIPAIAGILDKIIPDKNAAEAGKLKLAALAAEGKLKELEVFAQLDTAQMATNTAEGSSAHLFVAGWRPFVGWVCGTALAWAYILRPFIVFVAGVFHYPLPPLPEIGLAELSPILMGMLGLGGMRTYERISGVIPKGK
jgi:hypothetical protein